MSPTPTSAPTGYSNDRSTDGLLTPSPASGSTLTAANGHPNRARLQVAAAQSAAAVLRRASAVQITIAEVDRSRQAKVDERRLSAESINKTITRLGQIVEVASSMSCSLATPSVSIRAGASSRPLRAGGFKAGEASTICCSRRRAAAGATRTTSTSACSSPCSGAPTSCSATAAYTRSHAGDAAQTEAHVRVDPHCARPRPEVRHGSARPHGSGVHAPVVRARDALLGGGPGPAEGLRGERGLAPIGTGTPDRITPEPGL